MELRRRELLTAFLGLPVALAACKEKPVEPPPGELAFESERMGHRLRDRAPPPLPEKLLDTPVLIVGAGVAGLASAWRLARAGFTRFSLLELESVPGGTARSEPRGVVQHPWGAHYITAPMRENRALLVLLRELGIVEGEDERGAPVFAEQIHVRDPAERLYYRGRWYPGLYLEAGASTRDHEQLAKFQAEIGKWAAFRDGAGRRAFAVPADAGSSDPEVLALDKLSMADWLAQRGLDSPRLYWLVDYACRDDYGAHPEAVSAWAGIFYFASRLRDEKAHPQPILTWPEGNGRLVAHLRTAAKTQLKLGCAVAELVPHETKAGPRISAVALEADGTVRGYRAEQVIFAAPQFLTPHLIRPFSEARPSHVDAFTYGAWMVGNLHLRDRPAAGTGTPLAWDNVLYDSPALGYVTATHQRGLDHGPTILTYYHPLCEEPRAARARLLALGQRDWADVAITDLSRAHPDLRAKVERLDVARWGHAMIRPVPGFRSSRARTKASEPFRGIYFAHSDLSGLALFEEAFHHGIRAAEEVLRARGIDFEPLG